MSNNTFYTRSIIIDTSSDLAHLIIAENNKVLLTTSIKGSSSFSTKLLPTLYEMLKKTNTLLTSLKFIAIATGPGSYTGIRVGASIGKTIAFAKNIPLIGFSSLFGYVPEKDGDFLVMLDAKSSGVYLLEGHKLNEKCQYSTNPILVSIEESLTYIKKNTLIISPDNDILEKRFDNILIENTQVNEPHIIEICNDLYNKKKFSKDTALNLLYLRGPNTY